MTGRDIIWLVIGAACFFMLLSITVPHAAEAQQRQMMQMICDEAAKQEQHLREQFKEEPVWIGLNQNGMAFFVVQSPDGKTWTWLMRRGNVACIIADGANGQFVDGAKPETF